MIHIIKRINKSIALKLLTGMVVLLVLFSTLVGWIGFHGFTDALLVQYTDDAFRTADSAALLVNADHIDRFMESGGKSSEYEAVWYSMQRLCNSQDVTFIYVIRPDLSDYAHITFVFSTINDKSPYTVYDFGYVRETTNEEYKEKYRALYEGRSARETVIRDKGYIETDPHITAMVPLKGANGTTQAILCVQRQMDQLTKARNSYIRDVILTLIIMALLVNLGLGWYMHRIMLKPIERVTKEAERFASENQVAEVRLSETIQSQDEIGTLASSIDSMEEQIRDYVVNLTRVTAEKERMGVELDLAAQIQYGTLPHVFPPFPEHKEFALFASMDPAKEVGGDFYDYSLVDEDHLALVIADVSGKGIPAALFMMVSKVLINFAVQNGLEPAEALTNVNERICSYNLADMFVSVWLGILELSTGHLIAANAGHEYPAICRAEGTYELFKDKHGLVVGAMEGLRYKQYELYLHPGDSLFVYTDGVAEATDTENRLFGTDRMLASLNRHPRADVEETLKNMRADIDAFVGEAPQFDDITMMSLHYYGPADSDPAATAKTDAGAPLHTSSDPDEKAESAENAGNSEKTESAGNAGNPENMEPAENTEKAESVKNTEKVENADGLRQVLETEADAGRLDEVLAFVGQILDDLDCSAKTHMQIDLAVEEIFVNIANYAYQHTDAKGMARIEALTSTCTGDTPASITLRFLDQGLPYDPLAREDPDLTLSAEERNIGGLGVYLVKQTMDEVHYEYKDGRNILTIRKEL